MIEPYFLQTKRPIVKVFRYPWVTSSILQFLDIFTLSKCEYTWIIHARPIKLGMLSINTLSKDNIISLPSSYDDVDFNIKLKMFKILNLSLFWVGIWYMMKVLDCMMCIQLSQFLHQGTFGLLKTFPFTLMLG
jgi:hypothetical protein